MTGVGARFDSLRLNRPEMRRLGLALALSLAVHLLGWGGYEANRQFGWSQRLHWPAWLPRLAIRKIVPAPVPQNNEAQLTFVEVAQPVAEAPPNAKYYSSQNSRAGDPTRGNKDVPQLNGKQTEVVKTENVPRSALNKLQPAPPAPAQQPLQPPIQLGDLTLGKPENSQQQDQPRPRTVKQAIAQLSHQLPGQQMKQAGGMRRHLEISSLDAQATTYGAYDAALIDAVSQSWYHLLDQTRYASDTQGKVVVQFNLHSDGRVTDLKIAGDTADDLPGGIWAMICQAAIENTAPFARWSSDMLHEFGSNLRDVRFTFYY
jgi:outer membrane biosynthesis protein TonB